MKTTTGATAVRIVYSLSRGSREIEDLGRIAPATTSATKSEHLAGCSKRRTDSNDHAALRINIRGLKLAHIGNSGRVLAAAGYRPTGAASRRGIVNPARCLVTVYR
jgi:hypothetical protein